MSENIILNKYNFYELDSKPTSAELEEYYSKKYYQDNKGSYEVHYSDAELLYFNNKIEEKYWVINKLMNSVQNKKHFLDIGCGEGFTLKYFKEKGWNITGIDYSDFGCKKFNPDCATSILVGDIYQKMIPLIESETKFDVVWLDNVLEHVLDPLNLLKECKKLLHKNGVLVVEVPNDFSVLQEHLLSHNHINSKFWIVVPDHISYFNKDGLTAIASEAELKNEFTISDFPIDFNLVNSDTNYNRDKSKGKSAHRTRVELDNLMHSISVEKTVNYYNALADLGLGRQIISFFKHSKNEL